MKTLNTVILSALLGALVTSCSKSPKACFSVNVSNEKGDFVAANTGKVGQSFYFNPICSEKIHRTSTVFDFGDGSKADVESHVYMKPGTYTVKCTVYGAANGQKSDQSDEFTQTVTVTPAPQAQASAATVSPNIN
jgi:PKD repeat protein